MYSALTGVSGAYFDNEFAQLDAQEAAGKDVAKERYDLQVKQFKVNKALNIAETIMNTATAVVAALSRLSTCHSCAVLIALTFPDIENTGVSSANKSAMTSVSPSLFPMDVYVSMYVLAIPYFSFNSSGMRFKTPNFGLLRI